MHDRRRWSIDAGDRKSLSDIRHAVIAELKSVAQTSEDRLAAEILLGEILLEEAASRPQAVALELVYDRCGATLHIYSQIETSDAAALVDLQQNLASKCGLPLRLYITPQGVHIEVTFNTRKSVTKRPLKSLWDVACCILAARTERILFRRPGARAARPDDVSTATRLSV